MLENLEHQEFLVEKVKEDRLDLQVIREYLELLVKKEKGDFRGYQVHQV